MGQARARGTFEQRRAAAIARDEATAAAETARRAEERRVLAEARAAADAAREAENARRVEAGEPLLPPTARRGILRSRLSTIGILAAVGAAGAFR